MQIGIVRPERGANLRARPQGDILEALPQGTRVAICGRRTVDGYNWLEVIVRGRRGFVGAELVAVLTVPPPIPDRPPPPRPAPVPEPLPETQPLVPLWVIVAAVAAIALAIGAWRLVMQAMWTW